MTLTERPRSRRRRQWPTWLVSARHRTLVGRNGDSEWLPFGEHHAREAGESLTACGLVAIGWPVFWLMPFKPGAKASCRDCTAAVTSDNAPHTDSSSRSGRPACC